MTMTATNFKLSHLNQVRERADLSDRVTRTYLICAERDLAANRIYTLQVQYCVGLYNRLFNEVK